LLIDNNLEYDEQVAPKALDALMELVAEGTVSPRRIRESCRRIQALKLSSLTGPRR
jgi:beta-N-acetylhexosaminidase